MNSQGYLALTLSHMASLLGGLPLHGGCHHHQVELFLVIKNCYGHQSCLSFMVIKHDEQAKQVVWSLPLITDGCYQPYSTIIYHPHQSLFTSNERLTTNQLWLVPTWVAQPRRRAPGSPRTTRSRTRRRLSASLRRSFCCGQRSSYTADIAAAM